MWKLHLLALALVPAALTTGALYQCPVDSHPEQIQEVVTPEDSVRCLAVMIWGEARAEPKIGQIAVAYSAVNRAKKKTICEVILEPKQYSVFNGNPALRAAAMSDDIDPPLNNIIEAQAWQRAIRVAKLVINGEVKDPTQGSTHYLAPQAMRELNYRMPAWSRQYTFITEIGGHRFFRPCYPARRCIKNETGLL